MDPVQKTWHTRSQSDAFCCHGIPSLRKRLNSKCVRRRASRFIGYVCDSSCKIIAMCRRSSSESLCQCIHLRGYDWEPFSEKLGLPGNRGIHASSFSSHCIQGLKIRLISVFAKQKTFGITRRKNVRCRCLLCVYCMAVAQLARSAQEFFARMQTLSWL